MTTGTLRQPGIKERVEQLGYLLKHTFRLVERDPGILSPWIRMSLYAVVMVSLYCGSRRYRRGVSRRAGGISAHGSQ